MKAIGRILGVRSHPVSAAALVCVAALSAAEAAPQPTPRAPAVREAEEVKETIQVLMISSMKKALALTRNQEEEVIPKVQQIFAERERYARARRDALRQIQTKLTLESPPEKEVLFVVRRLDDLERTHRDQEVQLRTDLDKLLNARQQAEIRVFVPRFRREMQRRIEEARRLRAVPQPPPAPAVEEDWDLGEEEY